LPANYVNPKDVPVEGPARVILGEHGSVRSPIDAPPMTYLSVSLAPGERWAYQPPRGHTVAWVAVHEGALQTSTAIIPSGELAIFEPSEEPIDFQAAGRTGFVIGSAAKHPHDLVLGSYSVHTSTEALARGVTEIRRIGRELRAKGTI
jgi:redox-sensitive bicupin YhaK (pirin superfamily)